MCNQVKLEIRSFVMTFNSRGVFFKGTVLYGGYWLWAWQISGFAGGQLEFVTKAFGGSSKLSSSGTVSVDLRDNRISAT